MQLTAAGNIRIGEAGNDGGERKIDGNSHVVARAGGTIRLFNKIDGGSLSGKHSVVDFQACRGITIDDKIDGGSVVRLAVRPVPLSKSARSASETRSAEEAPAYNTGPLAASM